MIPVRPSSLLTSFLAALLGLLPLCLTPGALAQSAGQTQESVSVAEQYLLSAANQERAARGLPLLHRDPQLARAAAQHAEVMAEHEAISHQFPGEAELTERGASAGVAFSTIAENVAEAPSAVEIHTMWMNSEHHRENLLDPRVDVAGISVVARGDELFAVEDFAKTVRAVSLNEQESAIAALVAQPGVKLASDASTVIDARKTCAMPTGYVGARQPWFIMRFTSDSLNQIPEQLRSKLASGKFHEAAVGACTSTDQGPFTSYNIAVLLFP